jgi:hypothetical protein
LPRGLERIVGERGEDLREVPAFGGHDPIEEVVLRHIAENLDLATAPDVKHVGPAEGGEEGALS